MSKHVVQQVLEKAIRNRRGLNRSINAKIDDTVSNLKSKRLGFHRFREHIHPCEKVVLKDQSPAWKPVKTRLLEGANEHKHA